MVLRICARGTELTSVSAKLRVVFGVDGGPVSDTSVGLVTDLRPLFKPGQALGQLPGLLLLEEGVYDAVDFAVQRLRQAVYGKPNAVVGDPALRKLYVLTRSERSPLPTCDRLASERSRFWRSTSWA